ncbi:MAG: hypothetical protein AAF502_08710 [Bacteroidota bacterium]
MKKLLSILSLILIACFSSMAQDSLKYQLSATLDIKASYLVTDVLQNIYAVDEDGELIKFSPEGEELYRFNEFTLGMPTLIDATNPFKVLLYYPEFQTVVTLDNTLSKTGSFDLFDLDFDIIEALCFSNDGNIWLYDPISFKVKKIDNSARTLLSSSDLSLVLESALEPSFLLERENWLFVNDPESGILVFDVYGEYSKTLDMPGLRSFQVVDGRIIYFNDKTLHAFDLQSLDRYIISIPETEKAIQNVRIEKERLYLALEDEVRIYSF